MKRIYKVLSSAALILSHISIAAMVAITLITALNVTLRYVFNAPILGVYEIVERLMFCLVFAAFAYGQSTKSHVQVTMLISHLPQKIRFIVFAITSLLSTGMAIALTYAAYQQALYSFEAGTATPSLMIPLYPFFWIEFVAMFIFSLVLLADAICSIIAVGNSQYAAEIESTWT